MLARRKYNDSDEDIEKVLAELALEYSGEKSVKDKAESKSEPSEQSIDDEDKKKKGKKDKKKEKAEKNDIKNEDADDDASAPQDTTEYKTNNTDMEVSTVKTAAQKKKEKKEREKQKKLAQKKAVTKKWNLFIVQILLMWELFIPVLIVKNCNRKLPRNPARRERMMK